jgi:DNA-binding CsgD family transcriptional regulator
MLDPPTRSLSPRELEIVELVAKGHTDREIAKELGLTRKAVSNRLSEWIFPKLAVKNRLGAARWYLRDYSDQAYKYPDSYLVELRRLGLDREPQETKGVSQIFELSDHIGQWCAWCVRYFNPRDDIGAYHPYGKVTFSGDILFRELEEALGWAVLVHRDGCYLERVAEIDDRGHAFLSERSCSAT